jgi:hypothetical protein
MQAFVIPQLIHNFMLFVLTSSAQSPLTVITQYISHLLFSDGQSSLLSSFFLPYPDDLIVLLPLEVWKDDISWPEKESVSPTTFTSFLAWGPASVLDS